MIRLVAILTVCFLVLLLNACGEKEQDLEETIATLEEEMAEQKEADQKQHEVEIKKLKEQLAEEKRQAAADLKVKSTKKEEAPAKADHVVPQAMQVLPAPQTNPVETPVVMPVNNQPALQSSSITPSPSEIPMETTAPVTLDASNSQSYKLGIQNYLGSILEAGSWKEQLQNDYSVVQNPCIQNGVGCQLVHYGIFEQAGKQIGYKLFDLFNNSKSEYLTCNGSFDSYLEAYYQGNWFAQIFVVVNLPKQPEESQFDENLYAPVILANLLSTIQTRYEQRIMDQLCHETTDESTVNTYPSYPVDQTPEFYPMPCDSLGGCGFGYGYDMLTLEEAYNQGYSAGYNDGDVDGYDEGYQDGDANGYNEGYQAGDANGYSEGYNDGYSQGYKDGDTQSYNEGYQDGDAAGYNEGYQDGDAVGYNEGFKDGYVSGENDGYKQGYSDGEYDGYNNGYEAAL